MAQGRRAFGLFCLIAFAFVVLTVWLSLGAYQFAWVPYRNYLFMPSDFSPSFHRY